MKKRKKIIVILMIVAIAILLFLFIALRPEKSTDVESAPSENEITEMDEGEGIVMEEEDEGTTIEKVKKESDDFIGKWSATSDQAKYLYGNIDIEIKENGKWTANVTDEEFGGTWEKDDYGITLTSDLLDCKFYFSSSGNLIMEDYRFEDNDDPIITVLTKK